MREKMNSNKNFVDIMKNKVDTMMSQMFCDVMTMTGGHLAEMDPEQVALYNKYMRQYNEMWDIYKSWAEYQDEVNNQQNEKLDKIIGLLESKAWKQCISGQIEQNRLILADIKDRLDAVDKKNKKE